MASIGTKSLFFKGNQCAYIRRRYAAKRRRLGKAKKLDAIRKSKNKEARWMKDHNHKISRQIVNFAVSNGVGLIRMEDLTDIRNRAKSKKEAGRNLHSWAFYQLKEMIRYKAESGYSGGDRQSRIHQPNLQVRSSRKGEPKRYPLQVQTVRIHHPR